MDILSVVEEMDNLSGSAKSREDAVQVRCRARKGCNSSVIVKLVQMKKLR